jgi:hypothetical protein
MSTLAGLLVSLAIGVAASMVWLLLLFSVKPRLKVTVQARRLKDQPAAGWAFKVTNRSLVTAVQLQARLWRVEAVPGGFPTRHPIPLSAQTLFQLNGRWASARRSQQQRADHTGRNEFRFLTNPPDMRPEDYLGDRDRLLFQVWAQHGFTNFGRVKTFVITKQELLRQASPQTGSTRR